MRVNAVPQAARYKLRAGDRVEVVMPENADSAAPLLPSPIPLKLVYEDETILIVDKPPGLVVHPAPGHPEATMANALISHAGPGIMNVGGENRCGIVHRLDKMTSGLLAVAKTEAAHEALSLALAERRVARRYVGIAVGNFHENEATIDRPIGRRPSDRKRMGIVHDGREAQTSYRVLRQVDGLALLLLRLHTGRTHQIRVHLQSIGRPIAGDPEYGYTKARSLQMLNAEQRSRLGAHWPSRQMLHAAGLRLIHPVSGEIIRRVSAPPEDMMKFMDLIYGAERPDLVPIIEQDLESGIGDQPEE